MLKLTEINMSDMAGMYMTNGAITCHSGDATVIYYFPLCFFLLLM